MKTRIVLLVTVVCAALLFSTQSTFAQSTCGATVTVSSGDTLVRIAQRCATTVAALLAANPQITDPNRLLVGQVLTVPGSSNPSTPSVVAIYPLGGAPGTQVTVIANGLPINATVNVGVGLRNAGFATLQPLATDAYGGLQSVVTIPSTAAGGQVYVVTVTTPTGQSVTAQGFFVVGGAQVPTPAPSGTLFDRANIYLIALEDAGSSGQPVGCNDSAIPVVRTFTPTVAPLTAALQILLSLGSNPYYGESGLYNALYQSSLQLDSVNIVNREAIIQLSGQLVSGGVCDVPRLQAQLQLTALQFTTVERVRVFVNGQPLEQLLSAQ